MIDTHVHLNLSPLYDEVDQYLNQARAVKVTDFIVPGTDLDSSLRAIALSRQYPHCYSAVGIHPEEAANLDLQAIGGVIDKLARMLNEVSQIKAVGECGLDLFRVEEHSLQEILKLQTHLFTNQLQLAHDFSKPVVMHVREAHKQVLELLKQYRPAGVLHCFSGDKEYLAEALELGLYISFAGNVTFANAHAHRELLALVPLARLLLETDSPFLNPDRGQFPNHPAQITKVYAQVAELKQVSLATLEAQVWENAQQLFNLT